MSIEDEKMNQLRDSNSIYATMLEAIWSKNQTKERRKWARQAQRTKVTQVRSNA